ncbi:cation:proton antiporter domain-containing protein [Reticulibacter mediterranei]|nr:cation:proton antiporter [Reticulibacter mediterranei]
MMLTGYILLQLNVIILTVQVFGNLCRRIGQQWVIGEILAGLALGPSLLGAIFPDLEILLFPQSTLPMLQTLGDIGLALYMFSLGARLDTHLIARQSPKAIFISLSGILLPFVLGFSSAFLLYPDLSGSKATLFSFMLIVGVAMSITAFPVLARILSERRILHTKIGMLALVCASVDDVLAWYLLALVVAIIHSLNGLLAGVTVGLTIIFIAVMVLVVRPLLSYVVQHIQSRSLQIASGIVILLLAAYTTNAIGIHLVFGAFLTGVILPRNVAFAEQIRSLDQVNNLLFLPLFFVFSGLRTQIGLIQGPTMWLICLFLIAIACLGKIIGGTLTVRILGESWREALCLGVLMNTRGLVELIVLNIGFELRVLSPAIFAMLVIMAIVTTMMASPLLLLLGYSSSKNTEATSEEAVEKAAT